MSLRGMVIIQPGNKTLLVENLKGLAVDLGSSGDVVRSNATQPINGNYNIRFANNTQIIVVSEFGVSRPETVIKDGSTYNNNIGESGIDMVFQSNASRYNEIQVSVSDTVSAKDNYIDKLAGIGRRNYGTCTTIKVSNANPRNQKILIKFEIPSVVENVVSVLDVSAYFYKVATTGVLFKMEMYVIHQDNLAWTEGNRCNSNGINESVWNRRRFLEGDTNNGDFWAGGNVSPLGMSVAGVDFETPLLSNPNQGGANSWIAFTDNSGNFIDYALRMIRSDGDNVGLVIQTEKNDANGQGMTVASSEYTADISLRPKIVISFDRKESSFSFDGGGGGGFGGGGGGGGGPGGLGGPGGDKEIDLATTLSTEGEIDDTFATEFGSQE